MNGRKRVVEFGSGISTIIIARLIQQFRLDVELVTIDDNENWLNFIKDNIIRDSVPAKDCVTFIHAPLVDGWYDLNRSEDSIFRNTDLLII